MILKIPPCVITLDDELVPLASGPEGMRTESFVLTADHPVLQAINEEMGDSLLGDDFYLAIADEATPKADLPYMVAADTAVNERAMEADLGEAPQTGDSRNVLMYLAMALFGSVWCWYEQKRNWQKLRKTVIRNRKIVFIHKK